ncbi:glycosyltransferase [Candidatus Bathyarchaeota archaeon]|nr:MAG: glycosyltransferase [Candidatus Bathyarchaeota archaeon]
MTSGNRLLNGLVALFTFGSILVIMLVWLRASQNTILGLYSMSMTGFLIFMYVATAGYKPEIDTGFRPEITVVIPAKNEEEVIESVVRTVFNSDYPTSKMRVIVVDDGSTDRTWEGMQRAKKESEFSDRLKLVRHERNYGKRGCNQASRPTLQRHQSHGRIRPRRGHKQRRGNPPETTTLLVRRDVPTFERNGVPFWMRQLLFRHARRIPNKGDSPNNSRMGEGRTYHNRSNCAG